MSASDHRRLIFDRPATNRNDAMPIGNGRIGAMVYAGVAADRLSLNDDRLWVGTEPPEPREDGPAVIAEARALFNEGKRKEAQLLLEERFLTDYNQPMVPAGDALFEWDRPAEWDDYELDLDLSDGIVNMAVTQDGVTATGEYLASVAEQVIAVRFAADRGTLADLRVRLECQMHSTVTADGRDIALDGTIPDEIRWDVVDSRVTEDNAITYGPEEDARHYAVRLRIADTDGDVTTDGDALVVRGATQIEVRIAMATDYRGPDPQAIALADLDAGADVSYEQLRSEHVASHRDLFDRTTITLPTPADVARTIPERLADHQAGRMDPDLLALTSDLGRYLLIASARPGSLPPHLQGIWNDQMIPPWWDNWTINANLQMNYWGAHLAGLDECVEPLVDFVHELARLGERTAKVQYGAKRGWVANHQVDGRMTTTPIGYLPQGAVENTAQYAMWPFGGVWLSLHLFEHYTFTRDRAMLARNYPVIAGAAEFLLEWLIDDPENPELLATIPSTSPENTYMYDGERIAIAKNSTMDIGLSRSLFKAVLATQDALGIGTDGDAAALREEIATALSRLPETAFAPDGRILEFDQDWPEGEHPHRHISHLFELCPGDRITPEGTPELADGAEKVLEFRGDDSTGWSLMWKSRCWARLKKGDRALDLLNELFAPMDIWEVDAGYGHGGIYPNLLMACPPFMIEANLGYIAGLAELFVQDHAGAIDLLPACPAALSSGRIDGLRLREGGILSISWSDGKIDEASIVVEQPETRTIRYNGAEFPVELVAGENRLEISVETSA